MEASGVQLREAEGETRLSRIPCWVIVISDRAVLHERVPLLCRTHLPWH